MHNMIAHHKFYPLKSSLNKTLFELHVVTIKLEEGFRPVEHANAKSATCHNPINQL